MKIRITLTLVMVAAIAWGVRQRQLIHRLRESEERLTAAASFTANWPSSSPATQSNAPEPQGSVVQEAEFLKFTRQVVELKGVFGSEDYHDIRSDLSGAFPELCKTMENLTPEQLDAAVEAWLASDLSTQVKLNGLMRFTSLACTVNPASAVRMIYQRLAKFRADGTTIVPAPPGEGLQQWFRQDPDALLAWISANEPLPEDQGQSRLWADAALVSKDPSVENMRRFLGHNFDWLNRAALDVTRHLQGPADRLRFFQSLFTVTNGVHDNLHRYVITLAPRVPFTQLAYIGDQVSTMKPSMPQPMKDAVGFTVYLGSLRWEIAVRSRDGSAAQRWQWLVERPEDRPTGYGLGALVKAWCGNDYTDTANWLRSLPPGPERDEIYKHASEYLASRGVSRLAAEWKPK